jgi:hypothetical protein
VQGFTHWRRQLKGGDPTRERFGGAPGRTDAIRGSMDPGAVGFHQRGHVAPIGLNPPRPRPVHRRVIGIRDNHLASQRFQARGDPLAFRTGLQEDAHPGPPAEHRRELIGARDDAPLEHHRFVRRHDPNLAMLRVEIDGTIVHGWLLLCALSAFIRCGAVRYHPGSAGRFIPSILTINY